MAKILVVDDEKRICEFLCHVVGNMGHELNHLLNFKNPKVADPDKLDELGL